MLNKDVPIKFEKGSGSQTVVSFFSSLTDYDVKEQRFMTSKIATVCGIKDCRITRCGYTGEDGFEISVKNDSVIQLAQSFIDSSNDVKLAGDYNLDNYF